MGNDVSRNTPNNSLATNHCEYCGFKNSNSTSCTRCKANLSIDSKDNICEIIHIQPFDDGFKIEDISSSLIREILHAHFENSKNEIYRPGKIFKYLNHMFKVISCFPRSGKINEKTKLYFDKNLIDVIQPLSNNELNKITIYPTKASMPNHIIPDGTVILNKILSLPKRIHISEKEFFVIDKIQYFVNNCEPNNGFISLSTEINIENYIDDLKKAHILPVYETLSNTEKGVRGNRITEEQIIEKYLKPFFLLENRFLSMSEEIIIEGVTFIVVACEPKYGVVTCQTELFAEGDFLRAETIRVSRMRMDQEMALRLQLEETISSLVPNFRGRNSRRENRIAPFLGRDNEFISHRFQNFPIFDLENNNVEETTPKASMDVINRFPIKPFKKNDINEKKDLNQKSCGVCLSEFIEDEPIRTLYCFHYYHVKCIDKWLQIKARCPVCQYSVL